MCLLALNKIETDYALLFFSWLCKYSSNNVSPISPRTDVDQSYWGQDGANSQQPLAFYCEDDTIDTIPLAFLYIFRGTGGDPVIDFANVSSPPSVHHSIAPTERCTRHVDLQSVG
jgi:hypothetical protein